MNFLIFILQALFIGFSAWLAVKMVKKGANKKKAVVLQIVSVAVMMVFSIFISINDASAANSQTTSSQVVSSDSSAQGSKAISYGIGLAAAALVTGLSSLGAGLAVASAAPAAIAATSENPKAFGKSLVIVALGEGVGIYGIMISMTILSSINVLLK